MNIEIKKIDFDILNRYCNKKLVSNLNYIQLTSQRYLLSIDKEEALDIIDSLTEAFIEVGINKDSESNEIGLKIEGVIDVFSDCAYNDNET